MLASPRRPPGPRARSWVLLVLGWGLFNGIEGLIDHQILGIHHVHPGEGQLAWDLGFLALAVLQIVAGMALVRAGRADRTPPGAGA
ncbi:MAG TPA: DUF2243 domain-containing protein [Polyangiaceae bacterium]|nr:DUF2243 domain-containing protein [Polyangiaceae bacterium]